MNAKDILLHLGQIAASTFALVEAHPEIAGDIVKIVNVVLQARAAPMPPIPTP